MKLDIASTLSNLRREKKLSQKKAADELGISQALLSHYENGVREPKLEFIVKACDYYSVSTDYILGRTTEKAFGGVSLRCKTEDDRRNADGTSLIISVLDELGDDALSALAARYVNFGIFTVLSSLCSKRRTYEPLYDAAMKTAEAAFVQRARMMRDGDGRAEKLTDAALMEKYPQQFKSMREIEDIINKAVESLKQSVIDD